MLVLKRSQILGVELKRHLLIDKLIIYTTEGHIVRHSLDLYYPYSYIVDELDKYHRTGEDKVCEFYC